MLGDHLHRERSAARRVCHAPHTAECALVRVGGRVRTRVRGRGRGRVGVRVRVRVKVRVRIRVRVGQPSAPRPR